MTSQVNPLLTLHHLKGLCCVQQIAIRRVRRRVPASLIYYLSFKKICVTQNGRHKLCYLPFFALFQEAHFNWKNEIYEALNLENFDFFEKQQTCSTVLGYLDVSYFLSLISEKDSFTFRQNPRP